MIKIICFGYRDWAQKIITSISENEKIHVLDNIKSYESYLKWADGVLPEADILLFLGWSWIIPPEITEKYLCLGIHPSDLPKYRGGSPLQHQIIDGITQTNLTLMTLSNTKLDGGEIWMKQPFSLSGDTMDVIFDEISNNSIVLLNRFFSLYPDISSISPDLSQGSFYKRRKPSESKISIEQMQNMSLEQIYNFVRALTDPYPNAYIEDQYGNKLYLKSVSYIPNTQTEQEGASIVNT